MQRCQANHGRHTVAGTPRLTPAAWRFRYDGYSVPKAKGSVAARRYFVSGYVQGVGFRFFVERVAAGLRLAGYTRNVADGRVEVYAIGAPEKLEELTGYLWRGPRLAKVRGIEEQAAPVLDYTDFRIEYFS